MALTFRQFTIRFAQPSGTGTGNISQTVSFNGTVRTANAALKGFEARLTNADREIQLLHVDIDVQNISGSNVEVSAQLLFRDRPNPVDAFQGFIQGIVIADVV